MDADGRARIADFGVRVSRSPQHRMDPYGYGYLPRWDAPEVIARLDASEVIETEVHTKAADIFSFAMVMVEVRRGLIRFT